MRVKLTLDKFIELSVDVHNNKYDYSKVRGFKTLRDKVLIVCPDHGEFMQQVAAHRGGAGCRKCAFKRNGAKLAYSKEDFIVKCQLKHSNKYDYLLTDYSGSDKQITITCPVHGNFEQIAVEHLRGKGCNKCGFLIGNKALTTSEFITRAYDVHGTEYLYDKVKYDNNHKKVEIVCKKHGPFYQTPTNHLAGYKCKECSKESSSKQRLLSTKDVIDKINKNSPTTWNFDKFKYTGAHDIVTVTCPTHGDHEVICNSLFNGTGCPSCATHGFNVSKKAILYYLKITTESEIVYKIGITNRSIKERFNVEELSKIEILFTLDFKDGLSCLKTEKALLRMFSEYKRNGKDIIKTGNTELFSVDVLPNMRT